jgi:3-isopropylmalate/(R)-2-methylmalate dehydratase small subunit
MAAGFRAFVAPSFGDIFAQNCGKNGALAVVLPGKTVAAMRAQLRERPGASVTVDLPAQTVTGPDGTRHAFEINAFLKECLLRGQDEIALTLGYGPAIEAFEERHRQEMPWLARP